MKQICTPTTLNRFAPIVRFRRNLAALAVAFFLAICLPVYAQQTTATIVGNVTDTTGAVVVGAVVRITNVSTNTVRTTVTDGSGVYTLPDIPAGTYSLSIEMVGFQSERVDAIILEASQTARNDFKLSSGKVSEVIEVQASAAGAVLQTENGAVGEVINAKKIEDLPLNGRNFTSLLNLFQVSIRAPQVLSPYDAPVDR